MQEQDDKQRISHEYDTLQGCGLMQEQDDKQLLSMFCGLVSCCGLMQEQDDKQRNGLRDQRAGVVV